MTRKRRAVSALASGPFEPCFLCNEQGCLTKEVKSMTINMSQRPSGGAAPSQGPRFGSRSTLAPVNRTASGGGVFVPALEELRKAWNAYHAAKECLQQMGARAKMYSGPQS
jgi:hypothetical protein